MLKGELEFSSLFTDAYALDVVFKKYPQYTKRIINFMMKLEGAAAISASDLANLGVLYPEHKSLFILPLLRHANVYRRVIQDVEDLIKVESVYSAYRGRLIRPVIKRIGRYKHVINDIKALIQIVAAFPEYRNDILNKALSSFESFAHVVESSANIEIFLKHFPDVVDRFLDFSLRHVDRIKNMHPKFNMNNLISKFAGYRAEYVGQLAFNSHVNYMVYVIATHTRPTIDTHIEYLVSSQEERERVIRQLGLLKEAIDQSNTVLTAFQRRTFYLIIEGYQNKVVNLMVALGPENALKLLTSFASKSSIVLERFLKAYTTVIRKHSMKYIRRLSETFSDDLDKKSEIDRWRDLLSSVGLLGRMNNGGTKALVQLHDELKGDATLENEKNKIVRVLYRLQMNKFGLDDVDISENKAYQALSQSRYFSRLVSATDVMNSDRKLPMHTSWFREMIKFDLTGGSVDDFLHDTQQANPVGKMIAVHNKQVREKLVAAGIDAGKAVRYQKARYFVYDEKIKRRDEYEAIGKDIKVRSEVAQSKLNELLINESTCAQVQDVLGQAAFNVMCVRGKSIIRTISNMIFQLTRGKAAENAIGDRVVSKANYDVLLKLRDKLDYFLNNIFIKDVRARIGGSCYYALNDLLDSISRLERTVNEFKPRKFRAQQWDKSRSDTLLLGNYFQCCVSAGGESFDGMIERRLDDGMPIIVIIDEETNEPVCGAWLFFAEDELDHQVKLGVNFLELNNSYSRDRKLSNTLVSNLLYFIGEMYAKDIGVTSVVMRRLISEWGHAYGNINEFNQLKLINCHFSQKLGGFCPHPDGPVTSYYLVALNVRQFHQYTLDDLKKEYPGVVIDLGSGVSEMPLAMFGASRSDELKVGLPSAGVDPVSALSR